MNNNPIAEIKKALNEFHQLLGLIVTRFQIPSEIAERVLELPWESFEDYTHGWIIRENWEQIQARSREIGIGVHALDGFMFGCTSCEVGTEYAAWNGHSWIKRSDLRSDQED